ncbi:MAG: Polysaccharide deacetylase [Frankiales bacterium]|nr:Polysaccharide deacetylase [Frankiales bacterium]
MTGVKWQPTVLMYHGFSHGYRTDDPYHLVVSDRNLDDQLGHLRTRGWTALDLDGYLTALDRRGLPGRSYLVTIDDALRSVAEVGAPVLARAGVPSILFTPPGLLGGTTRWLAEQPDEPILTSDQLRALSDDGMEMGVHGWDHATMKGMTDAELTRNTVDARAAVADATGVLPRAFAYPFGDYDERALAAVARAGYEVAFSVYDGRGRHAVPRVDVKPDDSVRAFRLKLIPRYRLVWRAAGVVRPVRRLLRTAAQRT